jgi:hypothetical protein
MGLRCGLVEADIWAGRNVALQRYRLRLFYGRWSLTGRQERSNFADHAPDLVRPKLRIHREGQNFGSNPLADRKTSRRILKMAIGFLEMKRNRIVDTRSDSRLGEMFLNGVAVMDANHVQVVHSTHGIRTKGSDDAV